MQYIIKDNCNDINWNAAYHVLQEVRMASHTLEETRRAFENSYRVIFVFDNDLMVGLGRAISDGSYEAAIYDLAVLPAYQGRKIGNLIMEELHKGLINMNVILFSMPGVESFYKKLGYSKLLTGMAKFKAEARLRSKGFIE